MKEFKKELEFFINKHSIEKKCDIPDFLLAEMVCNMIIGVGYVFKKSIDWHCCNLVCHAKKAEQNEQERKG